MSYVLFKRILFGLAGIALLFGCNEPSVPSAVTALPETITENVEALPAEEAVFAEGSSADLVDVTSENSASSGLGNSSSANAAIVLSEESPKTRPIPAQDDIAERLKVAGIDNPQAAKDFLETIREAAKTDDKAAIATLVRYPFTTYKMGEIQAQYDSSDELLADFDSVVTDGVWAEIEGARYEDIFVNYQGAMIGNGAVWFMNYGDGIQIKAINPM